MAAEIRVDRIKSRTGINTLSFADASGFSFFPSVGIGTTVTSDPVTVANIGKLAVGFVTTRDVYSSHLNITGIATFSSHTEYADAARAKFGASSDIQIYHDSGSNYIKLGVSGATLNLEGTAETLATFTDDGACILKQNNADRVTTTTDGADFGGTGCLGIVKGTTGQRPGSAAAGDFRYNTTDGKFEGYTDSWGEIGGGGGVSQVSGIVSTTSTVGFAASFAIADYRSASVNFLINDATGASQAGKYIMIHDGTTVTVVEQVAVATGSMLGTLSGAIVGTNAELQVTMVSSGVATCSAKIDTMADAAA